MEEVRAALLLSRTHILVCRAVYVNRMELQSRTDVLRPHRGLARGSAPPYFAGSHCSCLGISAKSQLIPAIHAKRYHAALCQTWISFRRSPECMSSLPGKTMKDAHTYVMDMSDMAEVGVLRSSCMQARQCMASVSRSA